MEIVIFLTIKKTKIIQSIYTSFEKIFELTRKIVCSVVIYNIRDLKTNLFIYSELLSIGH